MGACIITAIYLKRTQCSCAIGITEWCYIAYWLMLTTSRCSANLAGYTACVPFQPAAPRCRNTLSTSACSAQTVFCEYVACVHSELLIIAVLLLVNIPCRTAFPKQLLEMPVDVTNQRKWASRNGSCTFIAVYCVTHSFTCSTLFCLVSMIDMGSSVLGRLAAVLSFGWVSLLLACCQLGCFCSLMVS